MKRTLIVFAKEPCHGRVKTRLAESLGDEKSLALYQAFLKDVLQTARTVGAEEKILAFDCDSGDPFYLKELSGGFKLYEQRGKDLGEKMAHAFEYAQSQGAEQTVIIGTDAPTLPAAIIQQSFIQLNVNDLVLGPSRDGGYYLIGLSKPQTSFLNNIPWSSDEVLRKTLDNAKLLGWRVGLLDSWYDIDTIEDFKHLKDQITKDSMTTAVYTRAVLENC